MIFKTFKEQKNNIDFHLHTTYTDGQSTLRQMAQKCLELGYTTIAFTDHVREDSDYLCEYFKEIDKIKKELNIEIYKGIEARICDFTGNIAYPKDKKAEIIVASVHRISINDKLFKINDFKPEIAFEIEKLLAVKAIKRQQCNIIGHTGGMCIHSFNEFPVEYFEEIIKACTEYNIAFEINSRYHKKYIHRLEPILEKYNPYVTYGSDAHNTEEIRGIYE